MDWISVKDRLPADGAEVPAWSREWSHWVRATYYENVNKWTICGQCGYWHIDGWSPFPSPRKEIAMAVDLEKVKAFVERHRAECYEKGGFQWEMWWQDNWETILPTLEALVAEAEGLRSKVEALTEEVKDEYSRGYGDAAYEALP